MDQVRSTTPQDIFNYCQELLKQRGENYGGIENNFVRTAQIASLRLNRTIHPYEVAVIMSCVKNSRTAETPHHYYSHYDAINYEMFASLFAHDYAVKQGLISAAPVEEPKPRSKNAIIEAFEAELAKVT